MYIANNGDIYEDDEVIENIYPSIIINNIINEYVFTNYDELILMWERNLRI